MAVAKLYEPGVHFTVIFEDFACRFFEEGAGNVADISSNTESYMHCLQEMAKILFPRQPEGSSDSKDLSHGRGIFAFAKTSAYLTDKHLVDLREKAVMLDAYWVESAHDPSKTTALDSYHALENAGFKGAIAQETRDYYISRVSHWHPTSDDETIRMKVCMNIASAWLNRQNNLAGIVCGNPPPIKLSLLAPTPGCNPVGRTCRIDWRSMTTDVSKVSMAPWLGRGVMLQRSRGAGILYPTIVNWGTFHKMTAHRDAVTLRLGDACVNVRCDWMECA